MAAVKSKKEILDYYEGVFNDKNSRYSRMVNELFPNCSITPETRILDYGCGTGVISHYLYNFFKCKIDAVDISEDEIEGAKNCWNNDKINWITLKEFSFPEEEYDLIISSQVIEHIHNVGNYLSVINKMLKHNAKFFLGTPNVMNFPYFSRQLSLKQDRLIDWSKTMLTTYDKAVDHINAWDTYHFVTLMASCGFELETFLPTEGCPFPRFRVFTFIPNAKKKRQWAIYLDKQNKSIFKNLCYTQYFIFKKVKKIEIQNND